MKFKEKSLEEIMDFINNEIPFNELKKNSGIYETRPIIRNIAEEYDISIGVTYEDIEGKEELGEWYYYNIFAGEEYVDLGEHCVGYKNDKVPTSTVMEIRKEISKLLGENKES